MTLPAGTRLGPYEITGPLGKGGMGEVWEARDPRLGRDVAIKVLPTELSSDAGRLKRFEKEARSASALNHPNIVTVYDIGSHDGMSWIAMERVDGETLRERLRSGALLTKKLLSIAVQIGEGLSKAHEAGIVHRDLKPENVMVTKDGVVKILDFGLAKLTGPLSGSDEGSHLPTETGTNPGAVVGTVGYMSPEQASGGSVDFRSDQFAFGSVLYEMATGKRAFAKGTAVDTLSAILHEEPTPIEEINAQAPAPLRWIVERCLSKEPEGRYAATRDLARDLQGIRERLSEAAEPSSPAAPSRRLRFAAAIAGAALVAATGAFLLARRAADRPPPSFQQLTFRRGDIYSARFAPDGESIVYTAAWDGRPMEIFAGDIYNAAARPFGLAQAEVLSISPSGEMAVSLNRRLGPHTAPVRREGMLARVSMGGGVAPREILEGVEWGDWAPDGQTLAVVREEKVEYPPGKILYETPTDGWLSDLRFSRDGERLAFIDHPLTGDTAGSVVVVDRSGAKKVLTEVFPSALGLAWSPEGDVWFTAVEAGKGAGSVFNQALYSVDLQGKLRHRAAIAGTLTLRDISRQGRLLITRDTGRAEIWTRAPGETQEREMTWLEWSNPGSITPDGRLITFTAASGSLRRRSGEKPDAYYVYIRKTHGSPPVRLGPGSAPILSPDGKSVLVGLEFSDDPKMAVYPTAAGEARPLPQIGLKWLGINHNAFLPDGKQYVFSAAKGDGGPRAYIRHIDGSPPRPITPEGYGGGIPSQDGKWILMRGPLWGPGQKPYLYSVAEGTLREIRGIEEGTRIIQVSPDARSLFLAGPDEIPRRVDRFDVATGRRALWRTFMPADPAGVADIVVFPTPSGEAYMYGFSRRLSDLYLLEGVP